MADGTCERAESGSAQILRRSYETQFTSKRFAERNGAPIFLSLSAVVHEVLMTFNATEGACAFAWRNYLLSHSGISEDDHRRSALHRYLTDLGHAGNFDFNTLQIAAVSYLKSLDELHDDRGARLAADRALAKRVHSRAA